MDLRDISSAAEFVPPHCFELCGRHFVFSLIGKDEKHYDVSLEFMRFPSREVTVTGAVTDSVTYAYDCAKVMDGLYQVACRCRGDTCVILVIDLNGGTAFLTVVTAGAQLLYDSFTGTIDGKPIIIRGMSTNELAGNTVEWTFGTEEKSAVRIRYGNSQMSTAGDEYATVVVCGSEQKYGAVYSTYRVRDDALYQYIIVEADGRKWLATGITNFTNMLGVGVILEIENCKMRYQKIGYYAKVISYEK